MLLKKFQQLAQWVGFFAIAALALYGLVSLGSGQLWAAGDESRPAAEDAPAITIPSSFNYQGILRDDNGALVNGTRKIRVSLWTEVQNGSELYFEEFPAVSVRDGLFNVVMGSTKTLSPSHFRDNAPLFVGVSVGEGAELLPRQRIHPVPWALLATSAQEANTLVDNSSVNNLNLNGTTTLGDSILFPRNDGGVELQGENFVYAKDGVARIFSDSDGTYIDKNLTVGVNMNVNNNLNVKSGIFLDGNLPVLIKRWNNVTLPADGKIPTGIYNAQYHCSLGGWASYYDIDENGSGTWSRWLYTVNDEWTIDFRSYLDGGHGNVSVEIMCFRVGLYTQQTVNGSVTARDGSPLGDNSQTVSPPATEEQGE